MFAGQSFDMSLVRGLDHCTGIIYEALCQPRHLPVSQTVMRQPRPKHHPLLPKKAKKPQAEDVEEEEEMDDSQVNVGSFRYAAAGEGTKGVQCTYIDVSIGLDRMIASVWPK